MFEFSSDQNDYSDIWIGELVFTTNGQGGVRRDGKEIQKLEGGYEGCGGAYCSLVSVCVT